jgi:hypothetical protein
MFPFRLRALFRLWFAPIPDSKQAGTQSKNAKHTMTWTLNFPGSEKFLVSGGVAAETNKSHDPMKFPFFSVAMLCLGGSPAPRGGGGGGWGGCGGERGGRGSPPGLSTGEAVPEQSGESRDGSREPSRRTPGTHRKKYNVHHTPGLFMVHGHAIGAGHNHRSGRGGGPRF